MKLIKTDKEIAWDIAYQIMIRSLEAPVLFMLHPGGEQYNCLSILQEDDGKLSPKIQITINGSSILIQDKIISPYPVLYKKDKMNLISNIAALSGVRISEKPVRKCEAAFYLLGLAAVNNIEITSAWYDGSYNFMLGHAAREFPYYPPKNETDYLIHLPWWVISHSGNTLAMGTRP